MTSDEDLTQENERRHFRLCLGKASVCAAVLSVITVLSEEISQNCLLQNPVNHFGGEKIVVNLISYMSTFLVAVSVC